MGLHPPESLGVYKCVPGFVCCPTGGPRSSWTAGQDVTRIEPVLEVQQKLPPEVDPDDLIPVEVRVKNTGRAAAEAITVTDVPRAGTELVSADPPAVRTSGSLGWHIGRLGPGEERVIRVRMKRAAGATDPQFMHTVEVTFQAKGRNTVDSPVRQPILGIEVAGTGAATVGTPVTLRMTVTNPGPTPVREIVLQTTLPDGLAHSHGSELERRLGALEPGQCGRRPWSSRRNRSASRRPGSLSARGMTSPVEETAKPGDSAPGDAGRRPAHAHRGRKAGPFELVVSNEVAEPRPGVEVRLTCRRRHLSPGPPTRGLRRRHRTVRWELSCPPGREPRRGVARIMTAAGNGPVRPLVVDGKVQGEVVCTSLGRRCRGPVAGSGLAGVGVI